MQDVQPEIEVSSVGAAARAKGKSRPSIPGYRNQSEQAEYFGVTLPTLWRWHRAGIAPPMTKIGGIPYYRIAATDEWLLALEKKPVDRSRRKPTRTKRAGRAA